MYIGSTDAALKGGITNVTDKYLFQNFKDNIQNIEYLTAD